MMTLQTWVSRYDDGYHSYMYCQDCEDVHRREAEDDLREPFGEWYWSGPGYPEDVCEGCDATQWEDG